MSPKIGDYTILPVLSPPAPSYPKSTTHYLYLRQNAPRIPTANDSRSLFVTNIPIDSTELHFRGLVVSLVGSGRFERAVFDNDHSQTDSAAVIEPGQATRLAALNKKRKHGEDDEAERAREEAAARLPSVWTRTLHQSGSTAVLVLADEKSVQQVLRAVGKLHKTKKYPVWGKGVGDHVPQLGVPWLRAHTRLSYPDTAAVQAAVDAFAVVFVRREREAAELAKRMRSVPDQDGFVTVTRGGTGGGAASTAEAEEARRKMLAKQDKKEQELTNFYRFQLREKKKAEQEELRRQFEEDRRRVAAMREKRGRFKPEA